MTAIEILANEKITASNVRLIINEKMIGIVSIRDALNRARNVNLDLVMVSGDGEETDTPICKILDLDKFRYEKAKNERNVARKQKLLTVETKELNLRPVTGAHDIGIKAKQAMKFLEAGDRVRVTLKLKAREKSHRDVGWKVIEAFLAELGPIYKLDKPPVNGESDISMLLGSLVSKSEKIK